MAPNTLPVLSSPKLPETFNCAIERAIDRVEVLTRHFTSGPWSAIRMAPFSYRIRKSEPPYDIIVGEIRCEGNAHLIASATELFEALEALLAITPPTTNPEHREIQIRAEWAIQNAVGL